jgi:hypothetical protein
MIPGATMPGMVSTTVMSRYSSAVRARALVPYEVKNAALIEKFVPTKPMISSHAPSGTIGIRPAPAAAQSGLDANADAMKQAYHAEIAVRAAHRQLG